MASTQTIDFNPVAGLATFILPGAGHFVLGRRKRGFFAMIGVLGLFFFGLLIGGIDAIDRNEDKLWFVGQALVGVPTILVDQVHQSQFKAYDSQLNRLRSGNPDEYRVHDGTRWVWEYLSDEQVKSGVRKVNTPGLGRLNEIAMLSIVLAGMLNLIVFLDAFMPGPERTPTKGDSGSNEGAHA